MSGHHPGLEDFYLARAAAFLSLVLVAAAAAICSVAMRRVRVRRER